MTTKFLDTDGRVLDHEIAEEMAYIEKPFREEKIGIIKSLFISRASEILKWQKRSEEFLNEKIEIEKEVEEKLRLAEKKRISEEKKAEEDRIKKEQEEIRIAKEKEEFELRNPQELQKLDTYIKYLKTQPDLSEAINFLYDFANKANIERSDDSYIIYRKARRALYEYSLDYFVNQEIEWDLETALFYIPSDWNNIDDDMWFLDELAKRRKSNRERSDKTFYRSEKCISIYRLWGHLYDVLNYAIMKNKSLAAAMIIVYSKDSWYDLRETETKKFIENTLNISCKEKNDFKLYKCLPTEYLKKNSHFMKYFSNEINDLDTKQKEQLSMNKEEYKIFLEQKEQERLQEIAEQTRIKKEKEEKIEQERKRKEAEEQARKEQERLQKIERDKLRQNLLNLN